MPFEPLLTPDSFAVYRLIPAEWTREAWVRNHAAHETGQTAIQVARRLRYLRTIGLLERRFVAGTCNGTQVRRRFSSEQVAPIRQG
jgi:hypothetical protein